MTFRVWLAVVSALVLSGGLAVRHWGIGVPSLRLAALTVVALGVCVSASLLRRERLARPSGLAAALYGILAGFPYWMLRGQLLDTVLLVSAAVLFVSLVLPGSRPGEPASEAGAPHGRGRSRWALGALAAILALFGLHTWRTMEAQPQIRAGPRVLWYDFASGLERARQENKLVLVDFYADWCVPCRMMDRQTFRDQRVVELLSQDVVPVRVDAEDGTPRGGWSGVQLADRYRVLGYPTLMLLDGEGRVVARRSGFLPARELLRWIGRELGRRVSVQAGG